MRLARPAGDAALLVSADGIAARLASAIRVRRLAAVLDVIPGARTVLVITEPGSWDLGELATLILALPLPAAAASGAAVAEIPVVYDGPDLAEVARLSGLDAAEVIARHQAAEYTVGWMGFSPGFGYLTGLDPALRDIQRLARPRLSVPAGSVAIAGGLACVYSVTSPGGWRLLGRTSTRIWDPGREPPALLEPGTHVRFRAVADLNATSMRVTDTTSIPVTSAAPAPPATAPAPPATAPAPPATAPAPPTPAPTAPAPAPASQPDQERWGRFSVNTTENRPHYREPKPARPSAPKPARPSAPEPARPSGIVIEVMRPGPLATIQDLGRAGLGHLGVPGSGAADAASLRLANRLAGNAEDTAGLEFTLGRAALRFAGDALVAVTGAPTRLTVTGLGGPVKAAEAAETAEAAEAEAAEAEAAEAEFGAAFGVAAGSVLRLAAPASGVRTYLAVRGGIDGPVVLGSRSADLLSGLGPGPLRAGDVLRVGSMAAGGTPATAGGTGPARGGTPATADGTGPARDGTGPARDGTGPARDGTGPAPVPDGPAAALAGTGTDARLRVVAGPRDDWFGPGALEVLCGGAYTVTAASNRTGLRLDGPALRRARDEELPSEGLVTGALQVPPDGMPILLLADHPVTGGYPVIAVVRSADISLAAQLRPGQLVRFTLGR